MIDEESTHGRDKYMNTRNLERPDDTLACEGNGDTSSPPWILKPLELVDSQRSKGRLHQVCNCFGAGYMPLPPLPDPFKPLGPVDVSQRKSGPHTAFLNPWGTIFENEINGCDRG